MSRKFCSIGCSRLFDIPLLDHDKVTVRERFCSIGCRLLLIFLCSIIIRSQYCEDSTISAAAFSSIFLCSIMIRS
ncbi:hypothetical protein J6590_060094, partial [Homalodisca vitripennis]